MMALIFDIEQAPATYVSWKPDPKYLPHYQQRTPRFIASWAARWHGEKDTHSDVVTGKEARAQDDKRIIASLAELVREADLVIGHAVEKHDLARLRGKVASHELEPLPPNIRSIDTLTIIKRDLGYDYNGMEPLAKDWGLPMGRKIGMSNWLRVLEGDPDALEMLRKYNVADIDTTEAIFERVKPYVRRLLRLVDGDAGRIDCPSCGSTHLQKRGFHRTQVSTYQRWQCQACKRYCRSKVMAEKRLGTHPL